MRTLVLNREKRINGAWAPYYVFIDGQNWGNTDNGETINIPIDSNNHSVRICADMYDGKHWSMEYVLFQCNYNLQYRIRTKIHLLSVDIYLEQVWTY